MTTSSEKKYAIQIKSRTGEYVNLGPLTKEEQDEKMKVIRNALVADVEYLDFQVVTKGRPSVLLPIGLLRHSIILYGEFKEME